MNGRIQEIQKKYANNQAKMGEEMQKLYAEEGVNPMSGCLWSFVPLPILLALYSIIRQPITHFMTLTEDTVQTLVSRAAAAGADMSAIVQMKDGAVLAKDGITQLLPYGQINLVRLVNSDMPELAQGIDGWVNVNYTSFGLDLTATPWSAVTSFAATWAVIGLILIPILAGASQFLLTRVTMKQQPQQEGAAAGSSKAMMYTMPLFSVYLAFLMPAALGVYWIAQSVFSLVQEVLMGKFYNKKLEEEEAARYEARQADRQRRIEEGRAQQERRRQEGEKKQSLKEKQQAARAAKAEKAARAGRSTTEAGRVGDRPYARGRSYRADRYDD